MRLFLIRHGESINNAKRLFTGWTDAPLTEKGRRDAESVRSFLSNFNFDKVYSSDLSRAYETAKIALPSHTPEKTPLIRELNVGSLENQSVANVSIDIINTHNYTPFGGEDFKMLTERVGNFTKSLECADYENVAIFTHAGVILAMLANTIGEFDTRAVRRPNCAIAIFDYIDGKWMFSGLIDPELLNN